MRAFIDLGAFKGQAINWLRNNPAYGPEYQCYAWECNSALSRVNYGDGVQVVRAAAWVYDGNLSFYINTKAPTIQGNSVYRDKTTGNLDRNHPVTVPCLDFSAWLRRTFTADDHVVAKINIEGAEYDVLEKCIADGTIGLLREIFIQWHVSKIPGIRPRHDALVTKLASVPNLTIFPGYGRLRVR